MSLAPINQEPEAEPEAELIRHLRNGIAHGNKFSMRGDVIDPKTGCLRLPAHNAGVFVERRMRRKVVVPAISSMIVYPLK